MSASPSGPDGNGCAGRNGLGQFTSGNTFSRGRRSRPSAWRIASERAEAEGRDIEGELWEVVKALLERAKSGDVGAARLVLDALCLGQLEEIEARLLQLEEGRRTL